MHNQMTAGRGEWMQSVVERHEGPLVRYAYRITGNLDQARDVVQDVFVRLWNTDVEQVEGRLAGWLFRVCRNRALDLQRKDNRMQPFDEEALRAVASQERSPDSMMEHQETSGEVLHLLASLPANQQEVVRLKFQNGLSYQEISEVTRLSVTNVGFLIHTAIKTLRQKIRATEQRPQTL